ncbi:MAG TPA: histidine kinase [Mycobacteriales bacterium]|nr:histidine kinase [Mycobacteriales bacterium]
MTFRLALPRPSQLRLPPATTFRIAVLVLCILLTIVRGEGRALAWLVAFVSATTALALRPLAGRWLVAALSLEAVLAGAAVLGTGGSVSPLLPYLLAPSFEAGAVVGLAAALIVTAAAAVSLAVGRLLTDNGDPARDFAVAGVEWGLLTLAVGLLATWARRLRLTTPTEPADASYVAAYRLLSQLRTVARQLSAGLDAAALAHSLLHDLRDRLPYDRAAVLVRGSGERLMPLVHLSPEPVSWEAGLADDSPFAEAWMSQQPQVRSRALSPGVTGPASAVVLPLRIGLRTFGLVALERVGGEPVQTSDLGPAQELADEVALRLETALLFNELREIATVEERRRIAREIHDGIAQELASWGYLIDGMTAQSRGTPIEEDLAHLRRELTRIISEIRLSIFDLRSEVDQYGGLGAALSEYVRSVGTSSRMTVHLSLDEGPARLPVDVEAELLRIAQEAITNARKHASAENLWVDCRVDPPRAQLRVEDDGVGLQKGREDSFGIEIMRERAARLRARLEITPREPRGTVVQVVVGDQR